MCLDTYGALSCVRNPDDSDYGPIVELSPRDTAATYAFWHQIALGEILELAARKVEEAAMLAEQAFRKARRSQGGTPRPTHYGQILPFALSLNKFQDFNSFA